MFPNKTGDAELEKKQHMPEQCPEHLRTPERPEMSLPPRYCTDRCGTGIRKEFLYGTENYWAD